MASRSMPTTKKCCKFARKLAKPIRGMCKHVRRRINANVHKISWTITPADLAHKKVRHGERTSYLPYGMMTAEEEEDRSMYTTAYSSAASGASRLPMVEVEETSAIDEEDEDNNGSLFDMGPVRDIDLSPSLAEKCQAQHWLFRPTTPPTPLRKRFRRSAAQQPRQPAVLVTSASFEDVRLAPREEGSYRPTDTELARQDKHFLRTARYVGGEAAWEWGARELEMRLEDKKQRAQDRVMFRRQADVIRKARERARVQIRQREERELEDSSFAPRILQIALS